MFYIEDGREHFYQWDTDRRIVVEDPTIKEVHFCNRTGDCSLVCEVYFHDNDFGGVYVANVPNILLQTDWKIRVYAYDGKHTRYDASYEVKSRTKPADYVYTETEVLNYNTLLERIETLEENGGVADLTEIENKVTELGDMVDALGVESTEHYNHAGNTDNPHQVSAEQVGAYTKEETDKALNDLDMAMSNWAWAELESKADKTELKDYVKNTDYATGNTAGVVKVVSWGGTALNGSGQVYLVNATKAEIDARESLYKPITPNNLDYAVKSVGDGYYATEAQVGDIETALDAIIAIQESYIGG